MDEILYPLNEKQKEAVEHTEGPLLVLAGAGSGKTRVITHRFAYLLKKNKITMHNILAVTFTNKAAGEMKDRISVLSKIDASRSWVRTFHSTGVMILRKNPETIGYPRDFVIYDSEDSKSIVKNIMKDRGIDSKSFNPPGIADRILSLKDSLITPEEFKGRAVTDFDKAAAVIYQDYEINLRKNKAVDFPDLISLPIKILSENEKIRAYYQSIWLYVMVDEFQDTNNAQYQLIKLFCPLSNNICVVGDDDQSIYGWRGANVENINDFMYYYKAKLILLEQNYRSTGIILSAAHAVVEKIQGRIDKKLWTSSKSGEKITVINALTDKEEAIRTVDTIDKLLENYNFRDFAIFYRTNAQSRLFEEELLFHNIPYKVFGGQKFYARKEVKDILSYIKLIINPYDSASLERIINVPKRKIGNASLDKIIKYAGEKNVSFIEALFGCENDAETGFVPTTAMKELGIILKELNESSSKMTPMNFVKVLIDSIGYKEYILNFDEDGLDRWENVEELINSIKEYENSNPDALIQDFINDVTLQTGSDELESDNGRDYISLMTIHNAKGLEFKTVFISGVIAGLIPHSSSLYSSSELNEERRLFYVGITRAMERLFLSYPETRLKYGSVERCLPSPFLKDIPDEFIEVEESYIRRRERVRIQDRYEGGRTVSDISEIKTGDIVYHRIFGRGSVIFVSQKLMTVKFDTSGIQNLMGNFISSIEVMDR
jgi:DNA helicase-2/ATP-dependent DNA helicase PcrA